MPFIPPPVRAILFDAVGTLIFPDPPAAEVYHREGQKLGSQYSADEVARRFHAAIKTHHQGGSTSDDVERQRWNRIIYAIFDDVSDPERILFGQLWRHFGSAASWRLFDDVAPVWSELKRRGYALGIASNFDSRLRVICQSLPPLDQCLHLFVSSEVGSPKPELRFFRAAEVKLGLSPEQILIVGDDYDADVAGPSAAGWNTVWLRRGASSVGPEAISTLRELATP